MMKPKGLYGLCLSFQILTERFVPYRTGDTVVTNTGRITGASNRETGSLTFNLEMVLWKEQTIIVRSQFNKIHANMQIKPCK